MVNDLAAKHVDQLYSQLEAVWEWRSRSALSPVALSAVLLAVVAGTVQAPAEFAGIRIVSAHAGKAFVVLAMFGTAAAGVALNAMDLSTDAIVRSSRLDTKRREY